MYSIFKKVFIGFLLIISIFSLSSCAHFESQKTEDYAQFLQQAKSSITEFLPSIEKEENIKDAYLYYSDRDLIDSYYTIYVECMYSTADYKGEEKRIRELFSDQDLIIEDSGSFDCHSIMYTNVLDINSGGYGLISYEYVLFYESESKIVYVTFFDKELNGKSVNIPKKYLPKELVYLRKNS